MRRLRKFWELTAREKLLLIQAGLLLLVVRCSLSVLPFTFVRGLVARTSGGRTQSETLNESVARPIVRAVLTASRHLLGEGSCLVQALALEWLFRRRGLPAVLRIGVTKGADDQLLAHAWIESDGRIVLGGRSSAFIYRAFPPIE